MESILTIRNIADGLAGLELRRFRFTCPGMTCRFHCFSDECEDFVLTVVTVDLDFIWLHLV